MTELSEDLATRRKQLASSELSMRLLSVSIDQAGVGLGGLALLGAVAYHARMVGMKDADVTRALSEWLADLPGTETCVATYNSWRLEHARAQLMGWDWRAWTTAIACGVVLGALAFVLVTL